MINNAKIIWIDDEHSSLEYISLKFEDAKIEYEGFEDAEQAIQYLKRNYDEIDALVIDGNFFLDNEDVDIDSTGKALLRVQDCLQELKHKKEIPHFVLSGQFNFRNRNAAIFQLKEIDKVFDKLDAKDLDELCLAIHDVVLTDTDRQILNKFKETFEVIQKVDKLKKHKNTLLTILKGIEANEIYYNEIRKVLETVFVTLASFAIIPEDFPNQQGWINGISKFFLKQHNDYKPKSEIIHPIIATTLRNVLQITQDGSHNEGTLKLRSDDYHKNNKTGFLYQSVCYAFLEILHYFITYIQNNQNKEINKRKWAKSTRYKK
ncbi:hypothetical protein [Sphingobacterium siyangense]|uniref:hypothetical protein n=1 Tax=Sphingobacterium siyangense TaxID=459529 RepID=UPI003DA4087F